MCQCSHTDARRTRSAMCAACPRLRNWTVCSIDNQPASGRTHCPKGRFPDAHGVVRWMRVRWYGVPYPLRVTVAALRAARKPLPGCGCIVRLKDLWRWIVNATSKRERPKA